MDLIRELDEAIAIAKETGKASAIVSAVAQKSKMLGYDQYKVEHDGNLQIDVNYAQDFSDA